MARVSVIIPNYNRASLIGETLNNMLRQTRPPDELIVVDDGSTDESVDVIKRFGDRVKLLRQANSGPGAARNLGFEHATGEFVQFFDSDDLCTLNKLEMQVAALQRTGADFAYGPWLQARLENGQAIYSQAPLQQRGLPEDVSQLSWFLRGWVVVFQSCMFRRSFLDRVGRYRTDLMPTEDSELLFRILKAGARSVHVPEALVLYRVHGTDQITGGGMKQARRTLDWLRYCEVVASQFDGEGETVSWVDALRWRATVWAASQEAAKVEGNAPSGGNTAVRFGTTEAALFWLAAHARCLRAGARGRLLGTRFPACYQSSPLTGDQELLIGAIGYRAVPAARFKQREARERSFHS
jgi:GT2 family glycosyltransferase